MLPVLCTNAASLVSAVHYKRPDRFHLCKYTTRFWYRHLLLIQITNTTGKFLVPQVTEPLNVLLMWLINTTTLKLEEFPTEVGLDYAILSHWWGDDEVLFKDLKGSKDLNLLQNKQGFSKVKRCCEQASRDKYSWAWVDTCCINKSSNAKLSEAINSMFH